MAKLPEKIGKYQIQSVLGWGSMAVVYHAIDPFMKRDVAMIERLAFFS
jgi:serine/threonine protein kinase